jgi:Na+/H+ antiporter NhaD/arsenite permease-like protein
MALITGVLCWLVYIVHASSIDLVNHQLYEHIAEIAGILFFLMGAMTIVELIDLYDGFRIIIDKIQTSNKRVLLLIITLLTLFLSSVLDNLTTAIVMTSLIQKILSDKEDRMIMIGMIIIASNAGGAWSPIGDVTTTMLWIGNQITPVGIIKLIFVPALIATLVPMLILMMRLKGNFIPKAAQQKSEYSRGEQALILYTGLGLLIFVPVFKMLSGLPPFMGMMLAVGLLWILSERLHQRANNTSNSFSSIFSALERIDMPSILFFMGILMSVGALQSAGLLQQGAVYVTSVLQNDHILVTGIGLLSAVFDNVPLVAAVQGMYDLHQYPSDHFFWRFLAFCSGTGGSIFIIGSAAGIAAMGLERITFFWYLKRISLAALLGYLAGAMACWFLGS